MTTNNSLHFRRLRRQVKKLDGLLPKVDIFGKYTDLKLYRMISYRMLCHAALESYFEEVSRDVLERSYRRWSNNNFMEKHLVSLCFRYSRQPEIKDHVFFNLQKGSASLLVKMAVDWHSKSIADNNGIKEYNIGILFKPYGNGTIDAFSSIQSDLDSYAAARGQYAHTTPSAIQTIPDPKDEKIFIDQIISSLLPIDQYFFEILKSILK